MTDVLSAVSLGIAGLSLLVAFASWWGNNAKNKEDRFNHWDRELYTTSAMYVVGNFKRKCTRLGVNYAHAFLAHQRLEDGNIIIDGADYEAVEKARKTMQGIYDGIKRHMNAGLLPAFAKSNRLVTMSAGNYLKLMEPIDAANWYLMRNDGDYRQPGRYEWIRNLRCNRNNNRVLGWWNRVVLGVPEISPLPQVDMGLLRLSDVRADLDAAVPVAGAGAGIPVLQLLRHWAGQI